MRPSIFFLLFFVLEIGLLLSWGAGMGFFWTLVEFFISGVFGMYLIRLQGFNLLLKNTRLMRQGESLDVEIIRGLMVVFSGVLLLFPGFASDIFGMLMLIPWLKNYCLEKLSRHFSIQTQKTRKRPPITIDQIDGD